MVISENKYDRLSDLDNAIDWALARFKRNIGLFDQIDHDRYVWKTDKLFGFPKVRIAFSYDEPLNTIFLVAIQELTDSNF